MTRARVNTFCATLPGALVSDPWGGGHDCWKVGGKIFALVGAMMPGVNVKTDSIETAQMLIDAGVGSKAPYLHRSWLYLPETCNDEELHHRLLSSYGIIRTSLSKKAQANLAPIPQLP
jgi:predicted DNA-binding protein (MmcQ/YjbR family)